MLLAPLVLVSATVALSPKPTMAEFVGLNTHTVQFKTDLYRPVTKHLRNYHPVEWDLGDDPGFNTTFPLARNRVNWDDLYPRWRAAGYTTIASLMFETLPPSKWSDATHVRAYGAAFGRHFGGGVLDAVEIGNEPGEFSDAAYRTIFEQMARGLRSTAPKLKIATCAVRVGPSGRYHKSVSCVQGLEELYDVLNIHTYAEIEPWPTWRRTHPENPKVEFLQPVQELVAWRNRHAPGKPIWVTEFGWDASTRKPDPNSEFAKWQGNSETEQAQWIVRAWLEFARLDVQRAYLFWFNDEDMPQIHGSSGLTRRYQPKPSYHAVAHFLKTLGRFSFERDVLRTGSTRVAEFRAKDSQERVWVVWTPTERGEELPVSLKAPGRFLSAERMPLEAGRAPEVKVDRSATEWRLSASGSPVYLRWVPTPARTPRRS